MSTRTLGLVVMGLGAVMSVAGAVGMVTAGEDAVPAAADTTSTTLAATTTTTTTTATTTTSSTEPSTTQDSTPIAVPDPAEIEGFVADFVGWIDAGDSDSLTARLHPVVIDEYGEDLCREFVAREILALEDYRLTGPVTGPEPSRYGTVDVDLFRAPVAFTFQGSEFQGDATFAFVDGRVRWFATCR
ncbi:MAG: hypothetical protein ACLGHX_10470 [Acidimicrobiia bacterium]